MRKKSNILVLILILAIITLSFDFLGFSAINANAASEISLEIALPNGERASDDIIIDVWSNTEIIAAKAIIKTVTIKKGASSIKFTYNQVFASKINSTVLNRTESLQYRIKKSNENFVSNGFFLTQISPSGNVTYKKTTLIRGTAITGKILLPTGMTAPKGGIDIAVEANYITAFMKIAQGMSYGFYYMVVPSNLSYKIYYSVKSNLPGGYAQEWVYSTKEIGSSVTDVIANGKHVKLQDQTLVKAGIISGALYLPFEEKAKNDLKIAISPKLLLDPPGIAKNETPLEALYLGLNNEIVIKKGENSAAFSISLPRADYAFEYRIISGLTVEKVNPKGTISRNNKRVISKLKQKDSVNQKFILNKPLSYYSIKGRINLPTGTKAKKGGLKVNLDFISQTYSTNISVTIPEGENSEAFLLKNMLEAAYAVSYNIVEQAMDYPEIKYNSQLNMITLYQDEENVSFTLASELPNNNPTFTLPKLDNFYKDNDPKTIPEISIPNEIPVGGGKTYYVSYTSGLDENDGLSQKKAFKTFKNLRKISFKPGDRILLKSGDTWTDSLYLKGAGSAKSYIQISSYGKGSKPLISGKDPKKSILMQLENPSYWTIEGISFAKAKLGIFLRITKSNNKNISIRKCDFDTFTDGPTVTMSDTEKYINASGGQIAFASAIFLGGYLPETSWTETALEGWEVKDCNFNYCDNSITNNWYRHEFYKDRMKNVSLENINIKNMTICSIGLNQINGGNIKNVIIENVTDKVFTEFGVAGLFFHGCSNFIIDGYIINEINRGYSGDGASIDFEYCNNITVQNSVFSNIDGMGLELLDTAPFVFNMEYAPDRWLLGYNRNLIIKDTTFYNSSRRPHTLPSGEDLFFDVYNRNARATVKFDNVTFYEGRGSHGTFSAKSKEFTVNNVIIINLDSIIENESKTADYKSYSDAEINNLITTITTESKKIKISTNTVLVIILAILLIFMVSMVLVLKFSSKKR